MTTTVSTDHVRIEVAFDSDALSTLPDWVDVAVHAQWLKTFRGRSGPDPATCGTGTASFALVNDGRYDPDLTTLYAGKIRRNRQVRISLRQSSADPWVVVHYGYVDAWVPSWPGGHEFSIVTVTTSDRFKLLARRSNTGTTVQEQAHLRLKAILDNGDTGGLNCIVPPSEYSLNPDGYACRTLIAHVYEQANTLTNCQEVAVADGGVFFVAGSGVVTFQGTRFRTDNLRATTSQGTFGGTTGAVPVVNETIEPAVDEEWLANVVYVGAGDGNQYEASDAGAIKRDARAELDLGSTLLRGLDAPDRVADVLRLRKDPGPRVDLVIDAYKNDAGQRAQALAREISDRVTVNILPPGKTTGTSRPYFIESVEHDVAPDRWRTKFGLSSAGGLALVDANGAVTRAENVYNKAVFGQSVYG